MLVGSESIACNLPTQQWIPFFRSEKCKIGVTSKVPVKTIFNMDPYLRSENSRNSRCFKFRQLWKNMWKWKKPFLCFVHSSLHCLFDSIHFFILYSADKSSHASLVLMPSFFIVCHEGFSSFAIHIYVA